LSMCGHVEAFRRYLWSKGRVSDSNGKASMVEPREYQRDQYWGSTNTGVRMVEPFESETRPFVFFFFSPLFAGFVFFFFSTRFPFLSPSLHFVLHRKPLTKVLTSLPVVTCPDFTRSPLTILHLPEGRSERLPPPLTSSAPSPSFFLSFFLGFAAQKVDLDVIRLFAPGDFAEVLQYLPSLPTCQPCILTRFPLLSQHLEKGFSKNLGISSSSNTSL
jgi:hypothetical protein